MDIQIYFKRLKARLVIYLQQNYVGRHTRNSLFITKIDAHYKDKVFPYGEFLHARVKYVAQYITCLPIKPNIMIHIKCDLVFLMNFLSTILLMEN